MEIKQNWVEASKDSRNQEIHDNVILALRAVAGDDGKIAFHSANPMVVKYVKDYDVRIPCGQITLDFEKYVRSDQIDEKYKKCIRAQNTMIMQFLILFQ